MAFPVFSAGKKEEGQYQKVSGLTTWHYREDISALPDGKYNVVVKGSDSAGNVTTAGPYNIFISAESDLAVVNVANPVSGMIVSGNLNVVGDAFDDDGISKVELKLDDGFYSECTGTSFWSYYIGIDDLEEGVHTITVRGTDINGLEGIEKSVSFRVDKRPPEVVITSHGQGSILSGKISISGKVVDSGGVKSLYVSENGTDYHRIKISRNKKSGDWEFSQSINTGKMEDGTYNYWYRSVDDSGTEGYSSFLFFVDNTPPELTVVEPSDGDAVNGTLFIAGKVTDVIGTKSLTIRTGSGEDDIPLTPGNPYWTYTLSPDSGSGGVSVELTAEDYAGNTSSVKLRLKNNKYGDLPVLSLYLPDRIGVMQRTVSAGIIITDDDGVKGYEYIMDGGDPVFEESGFTSVLMLNGLEPGRHSLKVTPVDVNGTRGRTVSASLQVPKVPSDFSGIPAPEIAADEPSGGVTVRDGFSLSGKIVSENGLSSLAYRFEDDPEGDWESIYADPGNGKFNLEIPSSILDDGNHVLVIRAEDSSGNISTLFAAFTKDSKAPELELFTPVKGDDVNGKITISGRVHDLSPVFGYGFGTDGENFEELKSSEDLTGAESFFRYDLDYSSYEKKPQILYFRTEDGEGNSRIYSFPFRVTSEADIPVVTIQFPLEMTALKGEQSISGTALDDDGIGVIYYSFDGEDFRKTEGNSTFRIPVPVDSMDDSIHSVRIKAEDINGVVSETVERKFYITRQGPVIHVDNPGPEVYTKGIFTITGTSKDSNGVRDVSLSLDNGTDYVFADGTENWSYSIDTTLLKDGTHSLYVKSSDNAGTVSFYTTILNVDNSPPSIKLDSPSNGSTASSRLVFSGKASDNSAVVSKSITILPVDMKEGAGPVKIDLPEEEFINKEVPVEDLIPGWYSIRFEAVDKAGNTAYENRSIRIAAPDRKGRVRLLYPLQGEKCRAFLNIEGLVESDVPPDTVIIKVDGSAVGTAEVEESGYFSLVLGAEKVDDGRHILEIVPGMENSGIAPVSGSFLFESRGPWILFDQKSGEFITERTFITGTAGYSVPQGQDSPELKKLEISYDNGRTFSSVKPLEKWKARIETELIPDGEVYVIAKAVFSDSSYAVSRLKLVVDKTPPEVTMETPEEGSSYNNSLELSGSAYDDSGIRDVSFLIREGDKNSYEVPSFIQGLYIDAHALGATYGDLGAGLTFFDDNVKLQLHAGLAPPGRFSGIVLGGKLLANVATVPYSYMFGPDWSNFSMAFAVGADFSYFTMSDDSFAFTDQGVVMGSVLGQFEFFKFRHPDLAMFNTYSLYLEGSLWFISSDVQAGVVSRFSVGARVGVF